jgi:hypothetical protein
MTPSMPSGPAKRAAPTQESRRRRQADGAPTPNPCQLVTRPAHCRFEYFQRLSAAALRQPVSPSNRRTNTPWRCSARAAEKAPGGRNLSGAKSVPFLRRTNIAQSPAFAKSFHRLYGVWLARAPERPAEAPPEGATDKAPAGRLRAADAMRTASENRRRAAAPVREQGTGASRAGKICAINRCVTGG